jgi:hypothetical protein
MSELSYPAGTLRGDYVRAALGLLLTIGPALAIPWSSPANLVLLPGACLFAIFSIRTWRRQQCRVFVNDRSISIFGLRPVSLEWAKIKSVNLSYFSTRRDHSGGWMQLKLRGEDPRRPDRLCTIRIDSTLDGFETVVRRAAAAATASGLSVSAATRANFAALGIDWGATARITPDETGIEPVREHG